MDAQNWIITGWLLLATGAVLFTVTQILLAMRKKDLDQNGRTG